MNSIEELLCKITKCPNIEEARNSKLHPCHEIVTWQRWEDFRVPEPWSGQLDRAIVLYIALNPGKRIGRSEVPKWDESCEKKIEFFTNRLNTKGRWWSNLRNRTGELGEDLDYAVTNVVHCKSKDRIGYERCWEFCCDLYLDKIIAISNAKIVVSIGNAEKSIQRMYGFSPKISRIFYKVVGPRKRLFAWLPRYSGSIGKFTKNYTPQGLEILKN